MREEKAGAAIHEGQEATMDDPLAHQAAAAPPTYQTRPCRCSALMETWHCAAT